MIKPLLYEVLRIEKEIIPENNSEKDLIVANMTAASFNGVLSCTQHGGGTEVLK